MVNSIVPRSNVAVSNANSPVPPAIIDDTSSLPPLPEISRLPFTIPSYVAKSSVPFLTVTEEIAAASATTPPSYSACPPSFIYSDCLPFCASAASIITLKVLSESTLEAYVPVYVNASEFVNFKLTIPLRPYIVCKAPLPFKPPIEISETAYSILVFVNISQILVPDLFSVISTYPPTLNTGEKVANVIKSFVSLSGLVYKSSSKTFPFTSKLPPKTFVLPIKNFKPVAPNPGASSDGDGVELTSLKSPSMDIEVAVPPSI